MIGVLEETWKAGSIVWTPTIAREPDPSHSPVKTSRKILGSCDVQSSQLQNQIN